MTYCQALSGSADHNGHGQTWQGPISAHFACAHVPTSAQPQPCLTADPVYPDLNPQLTSSPVSSPEICLMT